MVQNYLNTLNDSGANTKLCETVREAFRHVLPCVYVAGGRMNIFGQSIR